MMTFLIALLNWWRKESRAFKAPSTANNAAPRDHFAKVRDHFDANGNYIFKDKSIERLARASVGATMSGITAVGTPFTANVLGGGGASYDLAVSPTAVGDIFLLALTNYGSAVPITGVTGGGVTGWTQLIAGSVGGTGPSNDSIWWGTITTAGASTVHITSSSTNVSAWCQQFNSSSAGAWTAGTTNSTSGTGTSFNAASLTPTTSGSLYATLSFLSGFQIGSGGTAGFVYDVTYGGVDPGVAYNLAAGTTAQSPAFTCSSSSPWVSLAVVLYPPSFTAPSAPTLTSPANAATIDVSSGVTLTPVYNSTDGQTQNAYALRIKVSGAAYMYWNASTSALQSTIVWNAITTAPGASWTVTLPSTVVSNGNIYNWSAASQESGANLQGTFATDFTFTAQGHGFLAFFM